MRIVGILLSMLLSGSLCAVEMRPAVPEPAPPASTNDPDEVICTVNGERVRRQEVEDRMPPVIVAKLIGLRRRLVAVGQSEAEAQQSVDALHQPVFRQALRDTVRERLMLQEARRQGLQVSDLLFSETFEREWDALKARKLADQPGYEEKTVRERVRARLTLQAFRRQAAVSRDEDAWFREALTRSNVLDGGPDGTPLAMRFFFPNDRSEKPAQGESGDDLPKAAEQPR